MLRPQSFIHFHLPTFDPLDSRIFFIIVRRDGNQVLSGSVRSRARRTIAQKSGVYLFALWPARPVLPPQPLRHSAPVPSHRQPPCLRRSPALASAKILRINFPWAIWTNFVKFRCGRPRLNCPAEYRARAQKACVPSFLGRPAHGCARRISSSPAGPSDIAARLPFLPDQGFRRAQRQ